MDQGEAQNTDRTVHIFKRDPEDIWAPQDHVFITQGGGLGICVAGICIVKPPQDWHAMAAEDVPKIEPR